MTGEREVSLTTISIYLRALRAVFNTAIAEKTIPAEIYPFGKRKYAIPSPKGVKKALSKEQLKTLFETIPTTPEQAKAKAFWFFSYSCNGMNFKDMANLKYKDIDGGTLIFQRAKTIRTNTSQAPVKVYLTDFALQVIQKYGNPKREPGNHVFPIYEGAATAGERHTKLQNFIRYVNQHFLKLAHNAGIKEKVSTYWARHSFATNAIRSGASMEFVSEALSHSNLNTTRNYFAGFSDDSKKEFAEKLMNF
jgi:site-specific recombinase XerD